MSKMGCQGSEAGRGRSGPQASGDCCRPDLDCWHLFILVPSGHTWASAQVLVVRGPSISNVSCSFQLQALLRSADPVLAILCPFWGGWRAREMMFFILLAGGKSEGFPRAPLPLCPAALPSPPLLAQRTGVGNQCPGKGQIVNILGKSSTLPAQQRKQPQTDCEPMGIALFQ